MIDDRTEEIVETVEEIVADEVAAVEAEKAAIVADAAAQVDAVVDAAADIVEAAMATSIVQEFNQLKEETISWRAGLEGKLTQLSSELLNLSTVISSLTAPTLIVEPSPQTEPPSSIPEPLEELPLAEVVTPESQSAVAESPAVGLPQKRRRLI